MTITVMQAKFVLSKWSAVENSYITHCIFENTLTKSIVTNKWRSDDWFDEFDLVNLPTPAILELIFDKDYII